MSMFLIFLARSVLTPAQGPWSGQFWAGITPPNPGISYQEGWESPINRPNPGRPAFLLRGVKRRRFTLRGGNGSKRSKPLIPPYKPVGNPPFLRLFSSFDPFWGPERSSQPPEDPLPKVTFPHTDPCTCPAHQPVVCSSGSTRREGYTYKGGGLEGYQGG